MSERIERRRVRRKLDDRPIVERDDGLFEIGLSEPVGPFPTRTFAEAVAGREVRNARTT